MNFRKRNRNFFLGRTGEAGGATIAVRVPLWARNYDTKRPERQRVETDGTQWTDDDDGRIMIVIKRYAEAACADALK